MDEFSRKKLAKREVKYLLGQNDRLNSKYEQSGSKKQRNILIPEGNVEPVSDKIAKVLCDPVVLGHEFEPVFEKIKKFNEGFIGEDAKIATCLACNMPSAYSIQDEMFALAEKFAKRTVYKLKDPNPVETFIASADFVRALADKGLYGSDLITTFFVAPWHECYEWWCYQNTWADLLPTTYEGEKAKPGVGQVGFYRQVCIEMIGTGNWFEKEKTDFLLERLRSSGAKSSLEREALRRESAKMASDIVEMRPFICARNFSPARTILQITPEIYAYWDWGMHVTGGINIGWSEKALREKMGYPALALKVDANGRLSPQSLPWLTLDKLGSDEGSWGDLCNYLLLKKFHDLFLGFFEKMDLDAILAGLSVKSKNADAEMSEEEVAATCHLIAEAEDSEKSQSPDRLVPVKQIRRSKFFRILEFLECTIRQGKGDEIKLFRSDGRGRIFVIGDHHGNACLPNWLVRNILKRLEVTPAEWWKAVQAFGLHVV